MDNKIQLYDYVNIPVQKSECHDNQIILVNNDNNIKDFNNFSSFSSNFNNLQEFNDNFHPEITEINKCGLWPDKDDQIHQYLVIPDKITDNISNKNNKTVYIKYKDSLNDDININNKLFVNTCNGSTAVNKIISSAAIFDNSKFNIYIPTDIQYKTSYVCNNLPLSNLYTYSTPIMITKGIGNYDNFDVDTLNPITSINNDNSSNTLTISYVKVPEVYYDPINEYKSYVYTIQRTSVDGDEQVLYTNSSNIPIIKNDNVVFLTKSTLNTNFGINSNLLNLYENVFNENIANENWNENTKPLIACPDNSFISGYNITKSNDKYILKPHCISYTITSSIKSLECPQDGEWNLSIPGTHTLSCSNGLEGVRTRVCKDGQWGNEISTCKKPTCKAIDGWSETEIGQTTTKECTNGEGTITRKCIEDGNSARWGDITGSCVSDINSDISNESNTIVNNSNESDTNYMIYILLAIIIIIAIVIIIIIIKIIKTVKRRNNSN